MASLNVDLAPGVQDDLRASMVCRDRPGEFHRLPLKPADITDAPRVLPKTLCLKSVAFTFKYGLKKPELVQDMVG